MAKATFGKAVTKTAKHAAPAAAEKPAAAPKATGKASKAPEPAAAPAAAVPASRGPRGVGEDAVITLLVTANPKREGSKAHAAFSHYTEGMTVGEFCDAVGKDATPNLVYDAAHGFISIEGYTPGKTFEPKPKKEPKPKAEKASKAAPKGKTQAEVDADAEEEQVD